MSDRPSWHTCEVCKVPATTNRPLTRAHVLGNPRAWWEIHPECLDGLRATLKDGAQVRLVSPVNMEG